MDDTEDDARYPPNAYGDRKPSSSTQRLNLAARDAPHPGATRNRYAIDEMDEDRNSDDEEDGDDEEQDENANDGVRRMGKDNDDDDDDDDDIDNDNGVNDDDDDSDNTGPGNAGNEYEDQGYEKKKHYYKRAAGDFERHLKIDAEFEKHPKKRKLKNLISSYEFAPRFRATPSATVVSAPKVGGRNALTDWTEHETFVLLEAWGQKFLKLGRKSLRSDEWQEVAEKVSQQSKIERTDTQCRNRLDTLKKKYKKEKMKLAENSSASSKWVYFKKMDFLMTTSSKKSGLSCGVDSGEYVFMNPKAYLNRANGLDEMRDSPGNSESSAGEQDDSDDLPPRRPRSRGRDSDSGSSFRLLADSIQKFSEIYEKIENNKRKQMVELEKMRMDFHRELELQKRQILEKAQIEIAKIHRGDDEENDPSAENGSG